MYEKLCIIYQTIVNEIFKGIESVANESQKTPADVVRFQNYNQMNRKCLTTFILLTIYFSISILYDWIIAEFSSILIIKSSWTFSKIETHFEHPNYY